MDFTFTADALSQATLDETFATDALTQATVDSTFTADALAQAIIDETFTADALAQSTVDENFTINALSQATLNEDFTIDAITVNRFDENFITDALAQATTDFNFTVDSIIVRETSVTTDALLQATQTNNFVIDSILEDRSPTWQYREHETNLSFPPAFTFIVESSSPNRLQVSSGPPGNGVGGGHVFKTFRKSEITGSSISVTWEKTGSGALTTDRVQVSDGSYDKNSSTDFPTGGSIPIKGGGILGLVQNFATNHPEQTDSFTPDWSSSTEEFVTVFITLGDSNTGTQQFDDLFVRRLQVSGRGTWELTSPTVTAETTGGTDDKGYVNASSVNLTIGALTDAILQSTTEEVLTIDSILFATFDKVFTIDAVLAGTKEFTVDGVVETFGAGRSNVGDVIIRVLQENVPSLTGLEIVDKVVEKTQVTEAGQHDFVGKTSRIKNWIGFLERRGTIEEDDSSPDWYRTNWSLV